MFQLYAGKHKGYSVISFAYEEVSMRKRLSFLFFIFLIYCISIFDISASDTGLNVDGSLSRKSCIQIIGYDPLAEEENKAVVMADAAESKDNPTTASNIEIPSSSSFLVNQAPSGYSSEFANYNDPFGFGKNCVYHMPSAGEFDFTAPNAAEVKGYYTNGTHGYYLQQLAMYKASNFNGTERGDPHGHARNLLLVRIRLTELLPHANASNTSTTNADKVYEYFLGIFVSGSPEFCCGKTTACQCLQFPKKSTSNATTSFPDKLLSQLIASSAFSCGDSFYTVKPFVLNYGTKQKRLAPKGGDPKELRKIIEHRIFTHKSSKALSLEECSKAAYQRSFFTERMFGWPAYFSYADDPAIKVCFGKDLDLCFNQSEQTFLSFLEEGSEDLCLTPDADASSEHVNIALANPFEESTQTYNLSKIELYFYSTLDICRYCRGTLSSMLHSGKLKDSLTKFFKHGGVKIDVVNENIQMFAFSNQTTEIQ